MKPKQPHNFVEDDILADNRFKMNKQSKIQDKDILKIIGLIAIGILIGIFLSWLFMFISIHNFINNILPKIQVENINFDLNETALVNAINNTLK